MDTHSSVYKRLFATFAKWARQAHERRQLAQLDHRELSDLGISPADRMSELAKPFWRD